MVRKKDITNSELENKRVDKLVRGLLSRVLGEEICLGGSSASGLGIFAKDSNTNTIISVSRLFPRVTLHNPKYEVQAEEIAEAYQKMIKKRVILQIDYSEPVRQSP